MSRPARRKLAVYTGGFLFNARLRRILELHGWDVTPGFSPARADAVAVWGRRPVSKRGLWVARRWNKPVLNVEDAFLRSVRPGQAGEPPIGLLADPEALHYDAAQPSALERLLASTQYDAAALARAERGIAFLRAEGLSKYSDWDPDAPLPDPGYVLVIDQTAGDAAIAHAGAGPESFAAALAAARAEHPGARIVLRTHPVTASGHRKGHFGPGDLDAHTEICADPVNPWALLEGARAVYAVSSQMGFEAILAGHRPVVFGQPFYAGWGLSDDRAPIPRRTRTLSAAELFHGAMIDYPLWYDPYRDQATSFEVAAEALAAQARAYRENRRPFVCAGMSPWKHRPLRTFLAGPTAPLFESDPERAVARAKDTGRTVLLWAGKETTAVRDLVAAQGVLLWRAEDGFLRSVGLGAQLLPAASLVLDDLGIYFDPTRESRLERIINESAGLTDAARARAEALGRAIVAARLTKYNVGQSARLPDAGGRLKVLVPGQVEDDASIRTGTRDVSTNLELLRRARAHFPDAFIIFKPHPDVEVGLRTGAVPEGDLAALADHVAREMSAAEALEQVDVVWTMTSLMGFEALLRGKSVHCLGMPFYAGWGLTEDHGQAAPRRTARPDLAALIHAALIAYPRYFDAETGLAAPAEVILERLATGGTGVSRPATLRHRLVARLQDRLKHFAHLWRR
ncbi:capsular polysaccharide biosynthesis protein [Oceanibium sediminis]|uniref:capsular polysaccharide biosynthesis protein n=1 Tax=Oceanibium sediminis TaxID=2026339 RepID=UPI001E512C40|nr:capsular polysaccharide biosynthesis protein [Oceanibium sediminis]